MGDFYGLAIYQPVAPVLVAGQASRLRCDVDAILPVRLVGPPPFSASVAQSAIRSNARQWKAGAGTMRLLQGRVNIGAAANLWVMAIDKLAALANGDAPLLPAVPVDPTQALSAQGFPIVISYDDLPFALGINVAISSTADVLTLVGGAAVLSQGGMYT